MSDGQQTESAEELQKLLQAPRGERLDILVEGLPRLYRFELSPEHAATALAIAREIAKNDPAPLSDLVIAWRKVRGLGRLAKSLESGLKSGGFLQQL